MAYYNRVIDLEARLRESNSAIESYRRSSLEVTTNETALKKLDEEFDKAKAAALESLKDGDSGTENWRVQCEALEALLKEERAAHSEDRLQFDLKDQAYRSVVAKAKDRHTRLWDENKELKKQTESLKKVSLILNGPGDSPG